ncbi:MAG: peptide chain release factor N(5)-glutamine methyltransferase [Pseudomonadota bacterium]
MPSESWAALIASAADDLKNVGLPDPGREARLLARWAGDFDGTGLTVALRDAAPSEAAARFRAAVARRADRHPLSHITGVRAFWGRDFEVTPDVLDPRPETEILVAVGLERPFGHVLDLGTGTGCILLSLLSDRPEATGVGTDLSPAALAVAKSNTERLGLTAQVELRQTDWADGVEGPFDLIVSNPPYLAEAELRRLEPEVGLHEPRLALTPGGDGLAAYCAIASALPRLLAPTGRVLVEIGPTQASAVSEIMAAAGLNVLPVRTDLDGRDRVIEALAPQFSSVPAFRG